MDKIIEKLYMGELYPMREIYDELDIENSELKELSYKAETLEKALKENCNIKLLEEYTDIHKEMEHIVSKHSFVYGMRLGVRLTKL